MKFCPNCGAERVGDAPFCYECGSKFDEMDSNTEKKRKIKKPKSHPEKRPKKDKTDKKIKSKKVKDKSVQTEPSEPKPIKDDGYYDDVLPVDTEEIRQPLDKELIKRIIFLVAGVVLVITICILIMCYL